MQSMQRFPDVPKDLVGQGAIGVLGVTGILSGMPDGKFYPQSGLTRAQLASALARYLQLSPPATGAKFSDVSAQDAFAPAVAATVAAGLVTPASATKFGPGDTVTRQEMAVSLAKAFGLTNKPIVRPAIIAAPRMSDAASIAPAALDSVQAVIGTGYMSVFADGTFRPSASVRRPPTRPGASCRDQGQSEIVFGQVQLGKAWMSKAKGPGSLPGLRVSFAWMSKAKGPESLRGLRVSFVEAGLRNPSRRRHPASEASRTASSAVPQPSPRW